MATAIQLGQHLLPFHKILTYLTTSPLLSQYLRLVVIEETLTQWQQSLEYKSICSEAESIAQNRQISQLADEELHHSEMLQQSRTLQQYQQVNWGHQISSHFLARKDRLDRVILCVFEIDSLGMAQEIYLRVKDRRQSFDKLARLYSQGEEAKLGGAVGPIGLDAIRPEIAYHLMSLEQGQLSPLFKIDNRHMFIRLEQRLPARFDDEMKAQLTEELFEQ